MAVSVRAFVRARLEGFELRQAARVEKRKQQRAKVRVSDGASQGYFGFEMAPEERRAQAISVAYGNVRLHNPAITREDVARIYDELAGVTA
jgi:hypothetical protein